MPEFPDLERLYDDHGPALFAFLLNLTRHEAHTRDLLQEVFVKIARNRQLLLRANAVEAGGLVCVVRGGEMERPGRHRVGADRHPDRVGDIGACLNDD